MPFNDKKEWVNPPENFFTKEEIARGYTVCGCGTGVHLHEAGFEAEMFFCQACRKEVAVVKDFLTTDECENSKTKLPIKDEINSSEKFDLT